MMVDNLTDGANGLPSITSPLMVKGAGADTTIIQRDTSAPLFRIFHVLTGPLTLNGLTIRDGSRDGGGILNNGGMVIIINSSISKNMASGGFDGQGGHGGGGGILNLGWLSLTASTIRDNVASGGGGIFNAGTLSVTNSSISSNTANFNGGGIRDDGGIMTIVDSTISDNVASGGSGGGIFNAGMLSVTNSTFIDNIALTGGGISNFPSRTVTFNNSTISRNMALNAAGGIDSSNANSSFQNTILALNTAPSSFGPDCSGQLASLGNNIIGNLTFCNIILQASDLTGDPGLDEFTDDGTPGNGHFPLLSTSRAIDAGNDAGCPRQDQLGQPRVNVPGIGTSLCDIGAIEFRR